MYHKLLCLLGWHDWRWEYVSLDSCVQNPICRNCAKHDNKRTFVKHDWSEWEQEALNSCNWVSVCRRDGEKQTEKRHDYRSNITCTRCGFCFRCSGSGSVKYWANWGGTNEGAPSEYTALCPDCSDGPEWVRPLL